MSFATMALGALLSVPLLSVSGQTYDWDCNHYQGFPVGVCIDTGSDVSFEFECDGTDIMDQLVYSGSSCEDTLIITYTFNDTNEFQCDQNSSCDYMILSYYNDSDCSNEVAQSAITTQQCLSDGNSSYSFDCIEDDGEIALTGYHENDCTGLSFTQYGTPEELFGSEDDCIELTYCDSNLTGPPATSAIEDGTIGPFDCNLALWQGLWPFLEGECSYIQESNNDVSSYEVECDDDGEYAIIYEYNSEDCSGDVINMTYPDYYYCGAPSNECGSTYMSFDIYNDSEECDSDVTGYGEFIFATISGCYNIESGIVYAGFNITDNSVEFGYYFGECTPESRLGGFEFIQGCNDLNGSSAYAYFASTDGSSDSDSVDTTESTDDSNNSGSSSGGDYTTTYSNMSNAGETMSTTSEDGGGSSGAMTIRNGNVLFTNFILLILFVVIFGVIC